MVFVSFSTPSTTPSSSTFCSSVALSWSTFEWLINNVAHNNIRFIHQFHICDPCLSIQRMSLPYFSPTLLPSSVCVIYGGHRTEAEQEEGEEFKVIFMALLFLMPNIYGLQHLLINFNNPSAGWCSWERTEEEAKVNRKQLRRKVSAHQPLAEAVAAKSYWSTYLADQSNFTHYLQQMVRSLWLLARQLAPLHMLHSFYLSIPLPNRPQHVLGHNFPGDPNNNVLPLSLVGGQCSITLDLLNLFVADNKVMNVNWNFRNVPLNWVASMQIKLLVVLLTRTSATGLPHGDPAWQP